MIIMLDAPVLWQRQLLKIDCMRNKILTQGSHRLLDPKFKIFSRLFSKKQQFTSKIEWDLTTEKITLIQHLLWLWKKPLHFLSFFQTFSKLRESGRTRWHLQMVNNIKSKLSFMEMNKTYLWCIPFNFDVCSSLYWSFWLYSITSFCHTKGDTSGYAIKPKH